MIKYVFVVYALITCVSSFAAAQVLDQAKVVAGADRAWEKTIKAYVAPAPGCAAAVSLNRETVFEKAFGMAEMEHNIPNTPQTIFESGSVAKQFTAAALVLLAQEGKLSIDDPVRKYIPELPDYGTPLMIRHILNHTSGLRDWGSVIALTGVGRGDRVINQDLAFDIIVHQKAVDFTPGAEYSYTNSGYNLAAVIIERVSKQKFPDFVAERLFKPVGMKNSSWRDDYQRVVPGRAQAYARQSPNAPWRLNMPFMNVYGNGGMLTTVGDWMKWNAMLDSRSMGAPLVEALETQGILNDGRKITYALGLDVTEYKGMREVSHGGSTAGYQTFLARYPDKKLSVGVMCNGTSPSAGAIARSIVDEVAGPFAETKKPENAVMTEEQLKKFTGIYREEKTRFPILLAVDKGALRLSGTELKPVSDGVFMIGTDRLTFTMDKDGKPIGGQVAESEGNVAPFVLETAWTPTASELASFAGDWYSEEVGTMITFAAEGDKASIKQRPALNLPLRALYKDHFLVQGYVIWFTRDGSGKIDKMHVGAGRMRDMFFVRVN